MKSTKPGYTVMVMYPSSHWPSHLAYSADMLKVIISKIFCVTSLVFHSFGYQKRSVQCTYSKLKDGEMTRGTHYHCTTFF